MVKTDEVASWRVREFSGFGGLELVHEALPTLGDNDCLVKIEAASLNYRDLLVTKGAYPFPMTSGVVPGCDGAGIVLVTGKRVTRFKAGDRVCTTLSQGHIAGSLTAQHLNSGLGATVDGTLRTHGVFEEQGLVHMPKNLDFREASTLTCAAVSAWNALYGLNGRPVRTGDYVLTQGTGGVSIFAIQFALAAGAIVIATTSSASKEKTLKALGAHHVLNYRENLTWGQSAKDITPGGIGVDFVVEVGGLPTMKQSLTALRRDGIMSVVGFVGGDKPSDGEAVPTLLDALFSTIIVRGIAVGHRMQFEEMNRAIEASGLKPVIDDKVFALSELRDAYQYLWDQKHFAKVVVDCQRIDF